MRAHKWTNGAMVVAGLSIVALLPWLGAHIGGHTPSGLWQFPPRLNIPLDYPRFSWLACTGVVIPSLAIALSWIIGRRLSYQRDCDSGLTIRCFPGWGWITAVWTAGVWILTWTRFPWFSSLQPYTFFPLWLGFIAVLNALTVRRGGLPLMLRAPGRWALLFVASALFWWLFEWLNRFVRNWHYLGVEDISTTEYALHASLCFSTVLPAVLAVREWLGTFALLQGLLGAGPRWPWTTQRRTGSLFIATGVAALVLTGAYPLYFYPALWLAPLLLASSAMILGKHPSFWADMADGDWREGGSWALAALICGFFWELWNRHSFAKWIYTVPFVDRWHVFEMPLLGYAGYLPFGLECALVSTFLLRPSPASRQDAG